MVELTASLLGDRVTDEFGAGRMRNWMPIRTCNVVPFVSVDA